MRLRIALVGMILAVIAATQGGTAAGQEDIPDWSSIQVDPYPLIPGAPLNPVLTAADVTDGRASFVADPFLFHEGQTWYMFFEVYVLGYGRIAVARSTNGMSWSYDRIVLSESWHISFPQVFKHDGHYYMVPESEVRDAVSLYEASDFPYGWTHVATLVEGRPFVDPIVFRHNDTWWMFVGQAGSCCCYLFYSDSLRSGWREHPMSPIVVNDWGKARPAGRTFTYRGGRMLRLAQKCDVSYGEAVRAFSIDRLDTTTYAEHEIPESPILTASGVGWNADGMHQCDAWWSGDRWIASVDGLGRDYWEIGIYSTPAISGAEENGIGPSGAAESAGPPLTIILPNPFAPGARIAYGGASRAAGPALLQILDCGGRLVRQLAAQGPATPVGGSLVWNGEDARGNPVPTGVYIVRLSAGEDHATRRILLIR